MFRTSEDRFLQFLSLIAKVYKKKGPEEELDTEAEEDVEEEVRDAAAEDPADTPTDNPPAAEQQREQPEAPAEPPAANTHVRQEATFDLGGRNYLNTMMIYVTAVKICSTKGLKSICTYPFGAHSAST